MMGYVSVLLKISYPQFRVNPHGVNPELESIFEKNYVYVRSLVVAPPEPQQGTNTNLIRSDII